ncbi:MAG: AAA family ATPase [Microgenomates group bacterium]
MPREKIGKTPVKGKEEIARELSGLSAPERNPLLYPPHFESDEAMASFGYVVKRMIEDLGGLPVDIETVLVLNPYNREQFPRLVAKFSPKQVSLSQFKQLEEIAERMYPTKVSSTKNRDGSMTASVLYPKLEGEKTDRDRSTVGWYLGPSAGVPNKFHKGLFVFRNIGRVDVASGVKIRRDSRWFTQKDLLDNSGDKVASKYIVEIREDSMFQTDLAEAIVLTSLVLAGRELPPENPGLIYEIYHYMNRMGLKGEIQIGGLERQVAEIYEALFTPLASQDLAKGLAVVPRSATLVGQVGTGKTQIIRHLLNQDLGVIMVNIDAADFGQDLQMPEDKKMVLPRIQYIAERTGKSIVLIIEDIEHLARANNSVSATLLNELAGLFKNRYCVLCTTNHPEEFNPQLLESERLGGRLIFCPLPNEQARRHVLEVHTPLMSRQLGLELFDPAALSEETGIRFETGQQAREYILSTLAAKTPGFTPRYLQDLCNRAKTTLMGRIAAQIGKRDGLTESDLSSRSFSLADWKKAFEDVLAVYNTRERLEEDERLRKFVHPGSDGLKPAYGFNGHSTNGRSQNPFEGQVLRKVGE